MHCSFIKEKLIHLSNSVNKNNSAHALTMQDAEEKFKAAQGAEELKAVKERIIILKDTIAELEEAAFEYRNKIAERDIKIEALKEATVDAKGSVAILTDRVSTCAAISAADQVIPAQMFQAWALADDKRP